MKTPRPRSRPRALCLLLAAIPLLAAGCGGGGAASAGPSFTDPFPSTEMTAPGATTRWTYAGEGQQTNPNGHFTLSGDRTVTTSITPTRSPRTNQDGFPTVDQMSLRATESGQFLSATVTSYDRFDPKGELWRLGRAENGGAPQWLDAPLRWLHSDMVAGERLYRATRSAGGETTTEEATYVGKAWADTPLGRIAAHRIRTEGTVAKTDGSRQEYDVESWVQLDMGAALQFLVREETVQWYDTPTGGLPFAVQNVRWEVTDVESWRGTGPRPQDVSAPDVALFLVSGHDGPPDGQISDEYLSRLDDAGPYLHALAKGSTRTAQSFFYADHDENVEAGGTALFAGPGYPRLLADLTWAAQRWPASTRIVVVAHSHGGVWAHAALRDLNATLGVGRVLLIDLDTNAFGFTGTHGSSTGVGPVGSDTPGDPWITNLVPSCVAEGFEVQSPSTLYDNVLNVRTDGTTTGLSSLPPTDDHTGVHTPGTPSMDAVRDWLLARLEGGSGGSGPGGVEVLTAAGWSLLDSDRGPTSSYGPSTAFGGSYALTVTGAPDDLDLVQATLVDLHPGDRLTLTLAHGYLGDFSATYFRLGGDIHGGGVTFYENSTLRTGEPVNQTYQVVWDVDREIPAGTPMLWLSSVWPGSATYWFVSATK